jgi:hypothetical protein
VTGSRLVYDDRNRLVCIDLSGRRWLVLDLQLVLGFTPPGRAPTAEERMRARAPYSVSADPWRQNGRAALDDGQLDDKAALEAAYREQRREPVDLIGRAAA